MSTSISPNMIFCEKDNGKTFLLKVGFRGMIELSGNPTTSYSWRIQKIIGNSIQVGEWKYDPDSSTASMFVGGGGKFKLDFTVIQEGSTTILLIYDTPLYPKTIGYNYVLHIDARSL
jgi:predicted secreted protein